MKTKSIIEKGKEMLAFILSCSILGMIVGLSVSRYGREGKAIVQGAKKGSCAGCFLLLFLLSLPVLLIVVLIIWLY